MPDISVRRIDQETLDRLRALATRKSISMEEAVRRILRQAVAVPEKPGDLAVRLFSPAWGDDELVLPVREIEPPPSLR